MIIDKIDSIFRFTTESANWKYTPGIIPYNMFILILNGEGVFSIDNETLIAHPDEILFVPQGVKFQSHGIKNRFDYYCFQFYSSSASYPFKKRYKIESPDYFAHLYEDMFENWITKKIGYKFRIKSVMYRIFTKLLTEDTSENENIKSVNIISKSLSYMRKNYYEASLNIEDIAKESNITSAHFRNLFKEVYSISPLKHINKMRIMRATQLLEYTTMPINQISSTVGIPNVYHFNKLFKSIMNTSPGSYRRDMKNR